MANLVVDTTCGKVKGERINGVSVWKGIPYAKPPIGELRFRPPEEPVPWPGIREATRFGPIAMQPDSPNSAGQAKSEDCLYLNVWSPDADDRRRPVMVWLHGGAFAFGSGSESMYDGTSFALAGDVVVVTLNYRLGAFGFLYLGESGLDRYAVSGNCGLLDQIAALRWVRDNIQSFGGDPHQVTVFGESAGAISILNLLVMPEAKGLFHRAIIESPSRAAMEAEQAAANARSLLNALNVRMDDIGKLVQLPAEVLLKASTAFPQMSFSPVADGITIPERADTAIPKGAAKSIPVLIGSNQEEYRFFTGMDPSSRQWGEKEISARLEQMFGPGFLRLFPSQKPDLDLYNRIMSYFLFIFPTIKYAEALASHEPVWMYQFRFKHPALGACHAFELPFVWNRTNRQEGGLFRIETEEGRELADRMHHAWIAFARAGNPNTPKLPAWPKFDVNQRAVMVLDSDCRIEADPFPDRRIWESIFQQMGLRKN